MHEGTAPAPQPWPVPSGAAQRPPQQSTRSPGKAGGWLPPWRSVIKAYNKQSNHELAAKKVICSRRRPRIRYDEANCVRAVTSQFTVSTACAHAYLVVEGVAGRDAYEHTHTAYAPRRCLRALLLVGGAADCALLLRPSRRGRPLRRRARGRARRGRRRCSSR